MNEWNISEEAAALHRDALVRDMTVVWILAAPVDRKIELLDRLAANGYDLVSLALAMDWNGREEPLAMLNRERALLEEYTDKFVLFDSVDGVMRAKREGKLAVGFHFKSCPSGVDASIIEDSYKLGVRHTLSYNLGATEGDKSIAREGGGLSEFGAGLVAEMNRVGMLVDVTHANYATSMDILGMSSEPVVFSHSNAAALWDHPRNLRDYQIDACAKTGGVIGICGCGTFIGDNDNSTESLFRHIDYIAERIGPEHVGLGIDFVPSYGAAFPPEAAGWNEKGHIEGHRLASGGKSEAPRREDIKYVEPEGLPPLTEALIARGYGESDIRGILGENWLRVARQVWK